MEKVEFFNGYGQWVEAVLTLYSGGFTAKDAFTIYLDGRLIGEYDLANKKGWLAKPKGVKIA